jgi:uncharacterized repeat protein (TIGR03847 family)
VSDFLGLSRVDFITVGTTGPAGQRTFYLQAAQGDLVVSLVIEKEHAAALALGIRQVLEQLGEPLDGTLLPTDLELRHPLEPMFHVGSLGLGYDPQQGALVLVARAQVEEGQDAPEVRFWCSREQMYALAEHAAEVVAAGRPRCPLCQEPIETDEPHVCTRGNGKKRLYKVEGFET